MADIMGILAGFIPALKSLIWIIVGSVVVGGAAYYLFVVLRRRTWDINIWELKSNGRYSLVGKDKIVQKSFNKGKQTMFLLKYRKAEVTPPPDELVDRMGKKESCDYVRMLDDYVPLRKEIKCSSALVDEMKKQKFIERIKSQLQDIKTLSVPQINDRYIYAPINKIVKANVNYTPIEYDVNMMRINMIDNRELMYKQKESFLQKWGPLIAIGFVVVLIIVVAYLSFDYMQEVIKQTIGAANNVVGPLEKIVEKLGGATPPS